MAIPNDGSTGNGRNEEKSVEEGYRAERYHLYKRSRVGLRADWHLGSCLGHNVDKKTRILYKIVGRIGCQIEDNVSTNISIMHGSG